MDGLEHPTYSYQPQEHGSGIHLLPKPTVSYSSSVTLTKLSIMIPLAYRTRKQFSEAILGSNFRRQFSEAITNTDAFMNPNITTRYFHSYSIRGHNVD